MHAVAGNTQLELDECFWQRKDWFADHVNRTLHEYSVASDADDNSTSRIVHIDFDRTRLSRVMGEEEFLRGH